MVLLLWLEFPTKAVRRGENKWLKFISEQKLHWRFHCSSQEWRTALAASLWWAHDAVRVLFETFHSFTHVPSLHRIWIGPQRANFAINKVGLVKTPDAVEQVSYVSFLYYELSQTSFNSSIPSALGFLVSLSTTHIHTPYSFDLLFTSSQDSISYVTLLFPNLFTLSAKSTDCGKPTGAK